MYYLYIALILVYYSTPKMSLSYLKKKQHALYGHKL